MFQSFPPGAGEHGGDRGAAGSEETARLSRHHGGTGARDRRHRPGRHGRERGMLHPGTRDGAQRHLAATLLYAFVIYMNNNILAEKICMCLCVVWMLGSLRDKLIAYWLHFLPKLEITFIT